MKNEQRPSETHSSERYKRYASELALHKLAVASPRRQAEIIAEHYTSIAMVAMDLRQLLKHTDNGYITTETMLAIERMVDMIRTQHYHDFGIQIPCGCHSPFNEATPKDT